jgi:hypothetical protein
MQLITSCITTRDLSANEEEVLVELNNINPLHSWRYVGSVGNFKYFTLAVYLDEE